MYETPGVVASTQRQIREGAAHCYTPAHSTSANRNRLDSPSPRCNKSNFPPYLTATARVVGTSGSGRSRFGDPALRAEVPSRFRQAGGGLRRGHAAKSSKKEHIMTAANTLILRFVAGVVFASASIFAAAPSFAADDAMKGDAMHSEGTKGDKMKGDAMKGDKMQGDAMKHDNMHGDSMKGDSMKGDK